MSKLLHKGKGREQEKKPKKQELSDSEDEKGKKRRDKKPKKKEPTKGKEAEEEGEGEGKASAEGQKVSSQAMDEAFKEALLNALKLCRLEPELPIDSGRLFIDFILPARGEGVTLEVKDSSYKKLGKFFEDMAKQKLVEFKHNKEKKGQQSAVVSKIFYENEELKSHAPTVAKLREKEAEEKEERPDQKKVKLALSRTLRALNIYKLHDSLLKALKPQLRKLNEDLDEEAVPVFFQEQELRGILGRYVNAHTAEEGAKGEKKKLEKLVQLNYEGNPFLCDLLSKEIETFVENRDEEEEEAEEGGKKKKKGFFRIDREALIGKMLKKTIASHELVDEDWREMKEGPFKGIQVFVEKASNKNVTRIVGLEPFFVPRDSADKQYALLSNLLQTKFACSVSISASAGKNPIKELILHGAFPEPIQDFLTQEHGINPDYITLTNKLDKKKKN